MCKFIFLCKLQIYSNSVYYQCLSERHNRRDWKCLGNMEHACESVVKYLNYFCASQFDEYKRFCASQCLRQIFAKKGGFNRLNLVFVAVDDLNSVE